MERKSGKLIQFELATLKITSISREQMAICNFKKMNKITLFTEITVFFRKKWHKHTELELREIMTRLLGELQVGYARTFQNQVILFMTLVSWCFFNKEKEG